MSCDGLLLDDVREALLSSMSKHRTIFFEM